jgi:hypothetical protein
MNWPLVDSYGLWFSTPGFLIHQVRGTRKTTFAPGTSRQECRSGQCVGPRSWQRSRACACREIGRIVSIRDAKQTGKVRKNSRAIEL